MGERERRFDERERLERLLKIVFLIADRHAESKEGSGLLYLPVAPREMKELRSALAPFREE